MSIAEQARDAYAQGWAASGGPLTDRVRAGAVAAMRLAQERANDPEVLEVTLRLGHLEGVWAAIYDQRERLRDQHTKALAKALDGLDIDWHEVLTAVASRVGLAEAADEQERDEELRAVAVAAATAALQGAVGTAAWRHLRDVIHQALVEAEATGRADAYALVADAMGGVTADSAAAFQDAMDALQDEDEVWGATDSTLADVVDAAGKQIGRSIANGQRAGNNRDDLASGIGALLGATGSHAALILDHAMGAAISLGLLAAYRQEGTKYVDFLTAGDNRVCFPAGTRVLTPNGETPIENIRVGDLIVTPSGPRRVAAFGSRHYSGKLVLVQAKSMIVTATADHPFWTPRGWKSAENLHVGDLLKTHEDEFVKIDRILHLCFGDAYNVPSVGTDSCVAPSVSLDGPRMPVATVNLQGNPSIGEHEVNGPATNLLFLNKRDAKPLKCAANNLLKSIFAPKSPITGKAAKNSNFRFLRRYPSRFFAMATRVEDWGPTASLRTVPSVQVFFSSKPLPAASAVNVFRVASLADARTVVVSMSDSARSDSEDLAASDTSFCDRVSPASVVTISGAEIPVVISSVLDSECDTAASTLTSGDNGLCYEVAGSRTEDSLEAIFNRFGMTHEFFAALIAREDKWHEEVPFVSSLFGGGSQLKVYDIEVEEEHVFYANGILVHNCNHCELLEANSPYLISEAPAPPAHFQCRCTLAPSGDLSTASAYLNYLL